MDSDNCIGLAGQGHDFRTLKRGRVGDEEFLVICRKCGIQVDEVKKVE